MTMQIEEVFPGVTVKAFIPGLKPSFSPNPFHRSHSFSSTEQTHGFPILLLLLLSISVLLFSFSVLHFLVVVSVR